MTDKKRVVVRKGVVAKKMTRVELMDLIDDDETQQLETKPCRHGRRTRFLFKLEGKYYSAWVEFHYDDGVQFWGSLELQEVVGVMKTVIDWVPAPWDDSEELCFCRKAPCECP